MADTFPNIVQMLMNEKGLSQQKLSDLSGVGKSVLSRQLSGDRAPSFESLVRIADALNCSVDYLIGATDIPERRSERDNMYWRFYTLFSKATRKEKLAILSTLEEYADSKELLDVQHIWDSLR